MTEPPPPPPPTGPGPILSPGSRRVDRAAALRPRDGGRWGRAASLLAVVAVVGALVLAVLGRTLRAPPAPLAVAVTFLPYLYGGLAVNLLLGWFAFPARRTMVVGLAVIAAAAASLWGPRWSSAAPETGADVRVMSWNLRRLWGGPGDGGDAISCAIRGIAAQDPDVLTLLEVSADDVRTLSKKAGLVCTHHTYTADGDSREGGLATCTRGDRWSLSTGAGQRFVDDEDWYYVSSEVRSEVGVFNVLAVHLFPYRYVSRTIRSSLSRLTQGDTEPISEFAEHGEQIARSQSDQSAALLDRVDKFLDPTVIGGDFNSTRDSALHAALRGSLADAWERGGLGFGATVFLFDHLPLRVDYVYASHEFGVRSTTVPDLGCSDHRPVVTDLVLSPSGPARPPTK